MFRCDAPRRNYCAQQRPPNYRFFFGFDQWDIHINRWKIGNGKNQSIQHWCGRIPVLMLPTLEEHSKKTTVVPARCGELNCPLGPTPRDETVFGRGSVLLWLDGATFVVCHPSQLHWGCPGVRFFATLVGHASNDHRECLGVNGSAVANPELTVALLSCGTRTNLFRQRGCTPTGSLSGLVPVSDKLSGSMSEM